MALEPKAQADFGPDPLRHRRFTVVRQELGNPGALQVWEHRWLGEKAVPLSNESRLSCGALKRDSFHNLRAPSASSGACVKTPGSFHILGVPALGQCSSRSELRPVAHIAGTDRTPAVLLPEVLDDYVGAVNPVRFLDAFVAQLHLAGLGLPRAPPPPPRRPHHAPRARLPPSRSRHP